MKKSLPVVLAFNILLSACKTPSVLMDDSLKQNASIYPVKGRMGLQIRQKVSFGPYHTSPVKRSWIASYNIPFIIRFSGAKEKLSFNISDSLQTASVHCLGKISQTELQLVRDWFGIVLKQEDAFAGNISLGPDDNWDFIIYNASNTNVGKAVEGFLQKGDVKIQVRGIRRMEGKNTWLSSFGVYGYEFIQDHQVLATVETLNKGRVILGQSASAQTRLLCSALSCALLLKTDLEDTGRHNTMTLP